MRTRILSRICLREMRSRPVFLAPILAILLGTGLYTPRLARADGAGDPPKTAKSTAIPPDEPVSIESRKSTSAEPKVTSRPVDIRVQKTLVLINVTVTDPLNRFVTGLEKQHFRLFEDKVEQTITSFSSEDAPISIGLVFDTSGSMGAKLQKSRLAAA